MSTGLDPLQEKACPYCGRDALYESALDDFVRCRACGAEISVPSLASRFTGPNARYTELQMQHARAQSHADGFQTGWHAALSRVRQGDKINDLADLIPPPTQECSCQIDAHDFNCTVHNDTAALAPSQPDGEQP